MNTRSLSFIFLFGFFLASRLAADELHALQLEIGPAGANQVADGYGVISGAIGTSNNVFGNFSLAVGQSNSVGNASLAVGTGNSMWGESGAVFGYANQNMAVNSVLDRVGKFRF